MQARPYQKEAIKAVTDAFGDGFNRVAVTLPTGTGKTVLFSHIANNFALRDKRTLVVAHREELLAQAAHKITTINPELNVGIERADSRASKWDDVICASIQTIGRSNNTRLADHDFGLVIVDELHHSASPTYQNMMKQFGCYEKGGPKTLGVTATMHRMDNRRLDGDGGIFEKCAYTYSMRDAIRDGWLVDIVGFKAMTDVSLDGVKTRAGDYAQNELADRINTPRRNNVTVNAWRAVAFDRQTIVFCANVAHAFALASAFVAAGVSCETITGAMGSDQRTDVMGRFRSGAIQVLTNVEVATEGFDCLDRETEILTSRGWLKEDQVQEDDLVWSMNLATEKMELVPTTRIVRRSVRPGERMLRAKSQHFDIRTTEGHIFHVKQRSRGKSALKWYAKTGSELARRKGEFSLPLAACADNFQNDLEGISDDHLRLIGWALTDGWIRPSGIELGQSESKHHIAIRDLLGRLGVDFKEYKTRSGGYSSTNAFYRFLIPKGTHSGSLKRFGVKQLGISEWLDKSIPPCFDKLSRRQFKVLWDAMMLGNGARKANSSGWLWMPRKEQADRLTAMAVVRGYSTSCAEENTKAGAKVYRISIRDRSMMRTCPSDPRSTNFELVDAQLNEVVWCATNRNSTLVTRRNGKVAIIGNCPGIGCIVMARPTQSWTLYVQMAGRGVRPLAGVVDPHPTPEARRNAIAASAKTDCIVLDMVDNAGKHSLVTLPAMLGLPKALDLQGQKISRAADLMDELAEHGMSEEPATFEEIEVALERTDLLGRIKIDPAVESASLLRWLPGVGESYVLSLGSSDDLTDCYAKLETDIVGAYHLLVTATNSMKELVKVASVECGWAIEDAFRKADATIKGLFPQAGRIAGKNQAWREDGATEKQRHMLRRFGVTGMQVDQLTKGQASDLISHYMARR